MDGARCTRRNASSTISPISSSPILYPGRLGEGIATPMDTPCPTMTHRKSASGHLRPCDKYIRGTRCQWSPTYYVSAQRWNILLEQTMNTEHDTNEDFPCPCCGSRTISELGTYEVCEVCGWEDDPIQTADPEYPGGANNESLNEARTRWQKRRV
jgi:hypothetical protein